MESFDPLIYSHEAVLEQLRSAPFRFGFYLLRFYTAGGELAKTKTGAVSEFYLYPSGGTLRDAEFNIVLYDSRYDLYRGFTPPAPAR